MIDDFSSVSKAIAIAKKLKEISEKIKDADLKNLIAGLHLELADTKTHLAELTNENRQLQEKIRDLESAGEKCPRCSKRTWLVDGSYPHPTHGDLGATNRVYKCSECGFTETKMILPH